MVAKSNRTISSQQVVEHLDDLIASHRAYFAEWRSTRFPSEEDDKSDRDTLVDQFHRVPFAPPQD